MTDVVIRPFRPSDLEAAFEMDQRCFDRDIAYTRGQLRAFVSGAGSVGLVAEEGQRLAGFAIGNASGSRGHVVTIDIGPADRRRGVGRRLLDELLRRLAEAGAREVRLEVDLGNGAAVRFYERAGFSGVRTLPAYYGPGRDGLRMTRKLDRIRSGSTKGSSSSR